MSIFPFKVLITFTMKGMQKVRAILTKPLNLPLKRDSLIHILSPTSVRILTDLLNFFLLLSRIIMGFIGRSYL
jgi:hypothetical protein